MFVNEMIEILTNKETHPMIVVVFGMGIVVTGSLVWKILVSTYKTFVRPCKDLTKYGKWAIITGATDGIGKAYSYELAKKGCSVCLISRTESKLIDVCKDIQKLYPTIDVMYIVCDYNQFGIDSTVREQIQKQIDALEVGILINNVGISYRYPKYFHELTNDEIQQLLVLNINSTVYMTQMVLSQMIKRNSKNGGCIVNVSSASALYTLPLLAMYGGVKSFIEKFSRACNVEYSTKYNISFQAQVPFYVATKLAKMRKSLTVPTPEEYVSKAIHWIGYKDSCIASPFYIHAIQGYIMHYIPDWILANTIIMNMHLAIRKKGMKKDATSTAADDDKKTE